jgi:toxin ParE1/3/4
MTAQVFYHPHARHDLKDIFRHLAASNPAAAAAILRLIDQKACRLAETPRIGQPVEDLAPRLRRFPVGNYLIFYQISDRGINIVRVLHGARDIEALFQPSVRKKPARVSKRHFDNC